MLNMPLKSYTLRERHQLLSSTIHSSTYDAHFSFLKKTISLLTFLAKTILSSFPYGTGHNHMWLRSPLAAIPNTTWRHLNAV